MNTRTWTRTVVVTGVAVIGIAGVGAAPTAEAKRDETGGGGQATSTYRAYDIDEVVAMRKVMMARDYVANATAGAAWGASH